MATDRRIRGTLLVASALLLVAGAPARESGPEAATLYFFTTPEAEGGPEGARRAMDFVLRHAGELRLRPVLLAKDFRTLRSLTEASPLTKTLRELGKGSKPGMLDLPLYDEEGLRLAELWELGTVPSFVLVRGNRAHRISGAAANLELLWECAR